MMQETVLAGQNPNQPAIDAATGQPLTIEELLRRRGMLALNNVPSAFNGSSATAPVAASAAATPVASPPTAVAGALASANGVQSPSTGTVGTPVSATPHTVAAPVKPVEQMTDDELSSYARDLIGAGAGAASALLMKYMLTRKNNPRAAVPDLAVDPNYNPRPIEDAEFYPIRDNQLSTGGRDLVPTNGARTTPGHDTVARALANRNGKAVPDYSVDRGTTVGGRAANAGELNDFNTRAPVASRQQVGARQSVQSRTLPSNSAVIQSGDAYSDVPDDVMAQIRSVAQELSSRRLQGRNAVRAGKGVRAGVRVFAPPTAEVGPEGIVNELVRMFRANPNITRVISRVH
jgi:hypothetical protein